MPYKIQKLLDGRSSIINTATKKVHAKHTSYIKALKQNRLMRMMDS